MRRTVMSPDLPRRSAIPAVRPLMVALALTVALAGCTGGDPAPQEPTGPTSPSSLLGAGCSDLVNLTDVRAVLGEAVDVVDDLFSPGGSWPLASVGLIQAGGLKCEWSDRANQAGDYEALLEVDVLPNAADEWSEWFTAMSGNYPNESEDGTTLWSCDSSLGGSYHYCKYDVFAGGNWAAISVSNMAADADATPIVDTIAAALTSATSPAAEWSAPPLAGLPATCEELLPLDTVRTVLGVDDMDVRDAPLLMPYLHNTGLDGALNCSWVNPFSSALGTPLQVVVLPGAGWAWESSWAIPRPDFSPAAAVAELGDAAFAGCQPVDNPPCFVDVLVGEAWIALDGRGAADERTLTELAAEILTNLSN